MRFLQQPVDLGRVSQDRLRQRGHRHFHVLEQIVQVVEAGFDQGDAHVVLAQKGGGDVHRHRGGVHQVDLIAALERMVLTVKLIKRLDERLLALVLGQRLRALPQLGELSDDVGLGAALVLVGVGVGKIVPGFEGGNFVLSNVFQDTCFMRTDGLGRERHEGSLSLWVCYQGCPAIILYSFSPRNCT